MNNKIRQWLIIKLVRCAARGWTASYSAYVRCDKGEIPWWGYHRFWSKLACRIEHTVIPLARKLDNEHNYMGQEMVEHGWWG